MGLAPGSIAANSFWTRAKDKRILQEWGKARSAASIAEAIGTTRSTVLGRLFRLRRAAAKAGVKGWTRAKAERASAQKKRAALEARLIREMKAAVKRGMPRGQAMVRAKASGLTWPTIGEVFRTSGQNAYAAGKAWTHRHERAKANRIRKEKRERLQSKLIGEMARNVKRGMPANQAMARAHRGGATWVRIADHFGIKQQTAWYRAKIWKEQARPVRKFRRRKK